MFHRLASCLYERREPGRRRGRLLALVGLTAIVFPLIGCTPAGEGTVDLARARESAPSNPEIARASAARGKAGIGDAERTPRK